MKRFFKSEFRKNQGRRAGSILIYVLWLTALLGLFTLSIGYTARQKLKLVERIDARRTLRLAAESGVQRALWSVRPEARSEKKADALKDVWSQNDALFKNAAVGQSLVSVIKNAGRFSDQPVTYGLVDEESKIHINLVKDAQILRRLAVYAASSTEEEAAVIADSILDWIDPDSHVNASGAEDRYYRALKTPRSPKNAPLDTLEELIYVRGITLDVYRQLEPYLTLFGDGKVNMNTASETVLLSLGFRSEAVDLILGYRSGEDGRIGTADDGVFYHPSELLDLAGNHSEFDASSKESLEALLAKGLLKVTSDYYEVFSIATRQAGLERLTAKAVISRQYGIQSWREVNTRSA